MGFQANRSTDSHSDAQQQPQASQIPPTGEPEDTRGHQAHTSEVITRLQEQLERVRSHAKAEATRRAYSSDWKHFAMWCDAHGLVALPAESKTVALYLVSMTETHQPATHARRLTAITHVHQAAGHASPASKRDPEVGEAIKGLRRVLTTAPTVKRPLMTKDLHKVLSRIPPGLAGDRDRAILLIGYAGGLRRSELAAAQVKDIKWVQGEGIVLTLPRSKTDAEGKGRTLVITYGEIQNGTCPVVALRDWLNRANIKDGAVFRAVDRSGRVGQVALHSNAIGQIVKRAVVRAGYKADFYAGHSLRAGFATQAARNGVTVFDIMLQTGHRSVATVGRYIREGEQFTHSPSRRLGL